MAILKANVRKALFDVFCLGQHDGITRPTRAERKAAKWAGKVLAEQAQYQKLWEEIG